MSDQLNRIEQMLLEMKGQMDKRFDQVDQRFAKLEQLVRDSAQDILDNQVETVATGNLHESRLEVLEATTFRLDKAVLQLKNRLSKLEGSGEKS